MINKIDLTPTTTHLTKRKVVKDTIGNPSTNNEISIHISNVVSSITSETEEVAEMENVEAIKKLITENKYKIDPDALARKLYHSIFYKNMEI